MNLWLHQAPSLLQASSHPWRIWIGRPFPLLNARLWQRPPGSFHRFAVGLWWPPVLAGCWC
ncbi:hypothetical protein D3C72_1984170 [compost metagenome]